MKIAIDISQVLFGTGVSTYTKNLVKSLLEIDNENEYLLFGGSLRRYSELKSIANSFEGNFKSKILPYPPLLANIVWNKIHTFPIEKLVGDVDVVHTSDWLEPPTSKAFKITTVHDLYPFKFPRLVHHQILETHKRKMMWVLGESKRIIVPSNSTKVDLIDLGVKDEIIRVIPEAPTLVRSSETEIDKIKIKYNIKSEYLISIGVTPLKNTLNIIKAFHLAKHGQEIKLIIVGRPSNIVVDEQRGVKILGYVPQIDLGPLLSGSKGLIFPSLYEGYGIPILDAFSCEVPVVTSNTSSMPEVSGGAAILVDPDDINSIADGIIKALNGPKGLIEKGKQRLKNLSWLKTAKMTLDVYNEANEE